MMARTQPRAKWVLTVCLGLVVAGAGGLAWLWWPGPARQQPKFVEIDPGLSRWRIAQSLADAGVVHSAAGFELWSLLHRHQSLKAGTYRFVGGESVAASFEKLARGEAYTLAVIVPEGFTRFDIAQEIERLGLGSRAEFLRDSADPADIRDLDPQAVSLEGYLFPATYRVPPNATVPHILQLMTGRFRQELRRDGRDGIPGGDVHRWVILASLVEKETAVGSERGLIAGVFANRLARGLPLQCDPTVIYAAELAGRYTGTIRRSDLLFDSAYNTYRHTGLPPGPISNPGHAALEAAAHPDATPYLYFVSDGNGAHRFARTLAEQNRNVALYRRAERKAGR